MSIYDVPAAKLFNYSYANNNNTAISIYTQIMCLFSSISIYPNPTSKMSCNKSSNLGWVHVNVYIYNARKLNVNEFLQMMDVCIGIHFSI